MYKVTKGDESLNPSQNVSLEVLVNGRPIKQHKHNKKVYVEGRKDSEYSIKIKNNNGFAVYAIVSVDGLSVIDGTQASENSVGFLVEKYSDFTVPGWLMDEKTAAKFKFSEIKSSYSEKTNSENTNNIGVIGCIIISEKREGKAKDDKDWKDFLKELKEIEKYREKQPKIVPYPVPYPVYPEPYYPWGWWPNDWDYYRPRRIWYSNTYCCGGGDNLSSYGLGVSGGGSSLGGGTSSSGGSWGSGSGSGSSICNAINMVDCGMSPGASGGNVSYTSSEADGWYKGPQGSSANCSSNINGAGNVGGAGVYPENNFSIVPDSFIPAEDMSLGTEFGKKTELKKKANLEKTFDIGEIVRTFIIHYDSRKNLEKIGIVFEGKKKSKKKEANPFPASKMKFCDVPEGWGD